MTEAFSGPLMIVAGLGRCGLTMSMNMLYAAGAPCAGSRPAFEDTGLYGPGHLDRDGLAGLAQSGRILKWVDPINCPPVGLPTMTLLLRRDPVEQAKSQIKMALSGLANQSPVNRHAVRAMAAGNRADQKRTKRRLAITGPVFEMCFEDVLSDPGAHAPRMLGVFGLPVTAASVASMVAAVIPRGPKCRPDFAIEKMLIEASR